MKIQEIEHRIFSIKSEQEFNARALNIFQFQYEYNSTYRSFVKKLVPDISKIDHYSKIPFIPVELFKSHNIYCGRKPPEIIFHSSGTTGTNISKHAVARTEIYRRSFELTFRKFYGDPAGYVVIGLLPSYLEQKNSSLVYMTDHLIKLSKKKESGFYLKQNDRLIKLLNRQEQSVFLLGVSFALLDLAEAGKIEPRNSELIVMETGGMKGKRRELVREELHHILKKGLHVDSIHSEYGMTELLSQAYSNGNGRFKAPPWMKVLIRDTNDPLSFAGYETTGGINIIDLANLYSCSFISTSDLGKQHIDGTFEVIGRFDYSDIRGCNLMIG